ncbi:uncharacterized protein LOC117170775 [Belonocnema kinseyi]|uniref:uncharacterized protein LOC117170775 n=1 Tax=Belonocnema kinseyi TaxID=2817044 RepID=UPI00143CC80E|nr:uncharacterized protein LOC117170775 [Belonocnema kinseyi]
MKFAIPLLSLLIISGFPGNNLGRKVEIMDPINSALLRQYSSVCYVNGKRAGTERDRLIAACRKLQTKIRDTANTKKTTAHDLMKPMCLQSSTIKSLSQDLVNNVCISKKQSSQIVLDLVKDICDTILTLIIGGGPGIELVIGNHY